MSISQLFIYWWWITNLANVHLSFFSEYLCTVQNTLRRNRWEYITGACVLTNKPTAGWHMVWIKSYVFTFLSFKMGLFTFSVISPGPRAERTNTKVAGKRRGRRRAMTLLVPRAVFKGVLNDGGVQSMLEIIDTLLKMMDYVGREFYILMKMSKQTGPSELLEE